MCGKSTRNQGDWTSFRFVENGSGEYVVVLLTGARVHATTLCSPRTFTFWPTCRMAWGAESGDFSSVGDAKQYNKGTLAH